MNFERAWEWIDKNGAKWSVDTLNKEYAPDVLHVAPPCLTGKTELTVCYGKYHMVQKFQSTINGVADDVRVAVYDVSAKMPLMWSMVMTKEQAKGARALFNNIGYFDKPVYVD